MVSLAAGRTATTRRPRPGADDARGAAEVGLPARAQDDGGRREAGSSAMAHGGRLWTGSSMGRRRRIGTTARGNAGSA